MRIALCPRWSIWFSFLCSRVGCRVVPAVARYFRPFLVSVGRRSPRLSRSLVAGFGTQGRWSSLLAVPSFSPSSTSSSPLLIFVGACSCWFVWPCPSRDPCGHCSCLRVLPDCLPGLVSRRNFSWSSSSAVSVAVSCTVLRVNPQLVQLMRGAPRSHFLLSGELGIGLPCCAAQVDRDPSETPPQHEGWSSTEEENAGV